MSEVSFKWVTMLIGPGTDSIGLKKHPDTEMTGQTTTEGHSLVSKESKDPNQPHQPPKVVKASCNLKFDLLMKRANGL